MVSTFFLATFRNKIFQVDLSSKLRDKYQSSDQQWMKTVLTSGTINDKVILIVKNHVEQCLNLLHFGFLFSMSFYFHVHSSPY